MFVLCEQGIWRYGFSIGNSSHMNDESALYYGALSYAAFTRAFNRAQRQTTFIISGHLYPRVRYGQEIDFYSNGWLKPIERYPGSPVCGGCFTAASNYHLAPCPCEECPVCGGLALYCRCRNETLGT